MGMNAIVLINAQLCDVVCDLVKTQHYTFEIFEGVVWTKSYLSTKS